uniref:SAWADEE domain-containing protein n=1 Tax=Aegilops tauschii subsp. strangulata TaxID=200361 RepID=A0A453RGS0_AEGTS
MPTVLALINFFVFQEVKVRFSGFGPEEDEWINVRKCVRLRSLPCESAECVAVLPGDLILCFQVVIILQDFCSPDLALGNSAC